MSVLGVNYELNSAGISGLQIFYDFTSFSDGFNCIDSVASGNPQYSGEIINASADFRDNRAGSGFFTDQHIEIQNVSGITNSNCTIFFSQEKTGIGAGTLFSSFDQPSGFELGINDANKFYYKNIISGSLNYVTLESYPADKNLYAFTMSNNGGGSLYRLNFRAPQQTPFAVDFANANNLTDNRRAPKYYNFTSKNFTVPQYTVSQGDSWKIGSGEFLYQGYMDYFLYFNSVLGEDALRSIARSIHAEVQEVDAATGFISGITTGYNIGQQDVSGIIGSEIYISGSGTPEGNYFFPSGNPVTGTVGISGEIFVPQQEITGIEGSDLASQTIYRRVHNLSFTHTMMDGMDVSTLEDFHSSGSYWNFRDNSGIFRGEFGEGPVGNLFGITGFEVVTQSGAKVGLSFPILEASGVSGAIYNNPTFEALTGASSTYTGTGAYIDLASDADPSYYANALSLMGPPDPLFVYELFYDISGQQNLNTPAINNFNSTYAKHTAFMTGALGLSGVNLAINGVTDMTGKVTFGKNDINFPVYTINSGFDINTAEIFTHLILAQSDSLVFDNVPPGSRENLRISSLAQYASAPFAEITETNNQIFFNGVKLISGIDYTFAGGFRPQGDNLQATGLYFTVPQYTGDPALQTASGFLTEPISVFAPSITPYGYVVYFNGIRQPITNIIEHASRSDLITGTDVNAVSGITYTMRRGIGIYNDM